MSDSGEHLIEERLGLGEEGQARLISAAYHSLGDLRDVPVPHGTTLFDVADVILDTISGYASGGPVGHADLAPLVRDALEQLVP